jgi:O-antigen ligase
MKDKVIQITEKGAVLSLFGFVASIPVSITATQGFFILGMIFWGVKTAISFRRSANSNSSFRQTGMSVLQIKKMDGVKWGVLLFILAGVVCSITSLNPGESFFELRDFGFLFIIFFVSNHIRDEKHLKKLLRLLIGITSLTALLGIVQGVMGMRRVVGPQAITQTFSEIIILVLALAWPITLNHAKGKERVLYLIGGIVLSAALIFTYTRGAWLGLLAALAVILVLSIKRQAVPPRRDVLLNRQARMPILLIILYLAVFLIPSPVAQRTQSIGDVQDSSNAIRLFMWKKSPEILRDFPLTGVGLIDLLPIYDQYIVPEVPPRLSHFRLGHFHNNFIQVMVQMGLLGLTAFLFLWYKIILKEFRIFRRIHHSPFTIHYSVLVGSLAAIAAFLVSGLFEYNFGDSEVVMLMYFMIGIAFAAERINKNSELSTVN